MLLWRKHSRNLIRKVIERRIIKNNVFMSNWLLVACVMFLVGCAHSTYPAIIAKQKFEKKDGILFTEHKTKVQYSSTKLKKGIWNYLSQELNIPKEVLYSRASKLPKQDEKMRTDVKAAIDFLRQYGFEDTVIAESVMICFYPIKVIQEGLQHIIKTENKLSRFGLIGGFSETKCKFTQGSMLKDKRLQLCLYYVNLPKVDNDVLKIPGSMRN